MKAIRLTLFLLLATPGLYAAEVEIKAEAASAESQASTMALLNALLEKNLAGVESALQQGADIMAVRTLFQPAHLNTPISAPILAYVGKDGYRNSFEHDVLNLFFKYNKLNKDNLNMLMITNLFLDPYNAMHDEATPFQLCVISEAVDLVEKGIEHGGDVNKKTHGLTPLMLLADTAQIFNTRLITPEAEHAREQITQLLIKHGALLDVQEPENKYTALDSAISNNYVSMVKLLLQHNAKFDATKGLLEAVKDRSSDIVDLLLAHGVNPNGTDDRWGKRPTPLMLACTKIGRRDINVTIIERLLAAGADPLLEDSDGHDTGWYLTHNKPSTPEQARAIKMINDVIAERVREVPHPLFGASGIAEYTGEFLSGETTKNSLPVYVEEEEE